MAERPMSTDVSEGDAALALKIVETMRDHAWSTDPAGNLTYLSPSVIAYVGDIRRDLISRNGNPFGWQAVIHPDDFHRAASKWGDSLRTGDPYDCEHRLRRADGVFRWFRNSAQPSRDAGGRITQWCGTSVDIEDLKQSEAALRKSEQQLQQLVDAVPALIWCMTPEGIPSYLSKRLIEVTGITLRDLVAPDGSRYLTAIHPEDRREVDRALARSIETGAPFAMKYRQQRGDRSYRWVESRAEPLRNEAGAIVQWFGVSVDIEDMTIAQVTLRKQERELLHLLDMVPGHVWRLTSDGKPTFFNRRMIDYLGPDAVDLDRLGMVRLGALRQNAVHPEDVSWLSHEFNRCFVAGEPFSASFRLRRVDGVYRWMSCRAEPMRDDAGGIVEWYGLCHDIDDEMRAQNRLRERERELSVLAEMVPSNLWRVSPDGETTLVNKRMADFFGLNVGDKHQLEEVFATMFHPDDAGRVAEVLGQCFVTGEPFSARYRLRRTDGAYRWMSGRAEPLRDEDGHIVQWFGLCHDIEDQVRVEEELRERERALWRLVETVPAMIDCAKPDGEPIFRNKGLREFLGYNLEELDDTGKSRLNGTLDAGVHPEDLEGVKQQYAYCLATGEPYARRHRLRRFDGEYRWVETRAAPMRNTDGGIVQWNVICLDIDEQMRLYNDLQEREAKMRQILDTALDAVLSIDEKGRITEWNAQAETMFGWRRQEAMGRRMADLLIPARYRSGHDQGMRRFLASGDGPWLNRRIEISALRQNGEEFPVEVSIASYRVGGTWAFNGFIRDISERKLAEAKLAQATQAASLAVLSASIAHEVNQPLAAIVANSHACLRWVTAEPPNILRAKNTMERITRDANSAADVVSRIRALFRQAPQARPHEYINPIVNEVCLLMAAELATKGVRLETSLEPNLPAAALDRIQVQQVLVNLIRNGIDSMDAVSEGARVLHINSCRDGQNGIRIEVRDAGTGFRDAERVFEPFFTSKRQGMGMGLAICRSIIESHGGRVWVRNGETSGAVVAFTLPLAPQVSPQVPVS